MFIDIIPENTDVLYSTDYAINGCNLYLYFAKMKTSGKYNYFFKVYKKENDIDICLGYIYFTISKEEHNSNFIGLYIKPEYRSLGISSFLVSQWIHFCFNEGLDFLGTVKKQRKPFLVYLVKTFGFEILDLSCYEKYDDTIYICRKTGDNRKLLLFQNDDKKNAFMSSNIATSDSYAVVSPDDDYEVLDRVMLMRKHQMKERITAENKVNIVLKRSKK